MPWTASDAKSHMGGLSDKQAKAWADIANSALSYCKKKNGKDCEGYAVRVANSKVKNVGESLRDQMLLNSLDEAFELFDDELTESLKLADSHNAIRNRVSQAVDKHVRDNNSGDEYGYAYVVDMFDNYVVFSHRGKYYKAPYTDDGTKATLGTSAQTQLTYEANRSGEDPARSASDIPPRSESDGALDGATFEPGSAKESVQVAGELVELPLSEARAVRNGSTFLKIIQSGQGSSGYYPKEVLRRDGPKVFKSGLQMFWDHPTAQEETDRPEGSLRNLAGVLSEDAKWMDNGPAGAGLYAEAKILKGFEDSVNELAPHIGVSIRAAGMGRKGQVAGKPTKIIEELTSAASVDFVTRPGAGGQVLQLFEAARSRHTIEEEKRMDAPDKVQSDLREAQAERDRLKIDNDRLRESLLRHEAASKAAGYLSTDDRLSARAKQRVIQIATVEIPQKDGKIDEPAFKEAVKHVADEEAAYLTEAAGATGAVKGANHQEKTEAKESAVDIDKLRKEQDEYLVVWGVREAKNGN